MVRYISQGQRIHFSKEIGRHVVGTRSSVVIPEGLRRNGNNSRRREVQAKETPRPIVRYRHGAPEIERKHPNILSRTHSFRLLCGTNPPSRHMIDCGPDIRYPAFLSSLVQSRIPYGLPDGIENPSKTLSSTTLGLICSIGTTNPATRPRFCNGV